MILKKQLNEILHQALHHQNNGDYSSAIKLYQEVLKSDPKNPDVYNNLAIIYLNINDLVKAENIIIDYLTNTSGDATAFNNLAIVYQRTNRVPQSIKLLEHALSLDPFKFETFLNLTNSHSLLHQNNEALHFALEAVKINPTSSGAFNNLGSILNTLAMFSESKIAFETAVDLDKNNIEATINLATVFIREGKRDEAIKVYEKILRKLPKHLKPKQHVIKFLLANEYLTRGEIAKGWELYDSGFDPSVPLTNARSPSRTFSKPRWDGKMHNGKTLLIWKEQGLGDEIMFYSILPDLFNKFKDMKFIIECDYRMVPILSRTFPDVLVRQQSFYGAPKFKSFHDDFDYEVPVASLNRHFRKSIADYKNAEPLKFITDPDLNFDFKNRLSNLTGKLKIGFCWRSGQIDPLRNLCYTEIGDWASLFQLKDVDWVNLQYGECEGEVQFAETNFDVKIHRWSDVNLKDDLDKVFSIIENLDLVITVATAVQYMSAAMRKPVLLVTLPQAFHRFNCDFDPWFSNLMPFENMDIKACLGMIENYLIENYSLVKR